MNDYRECIEVSDAEFAALMRGVVVCLTIRPEDAHLEEWDIMDVWCEDQGLFHRMSVQTERLRDDVYRLQAWSHTEVDE